MKLILIIMCIIAAIPIAYVVIVMFLFTCLATVGGIGRYFGEWRFYRKLKQATRVMSVDEVCQKLQAGKGSLLLESPYPGWNAARLWWTPDDVDSISPCDRDDPFEDDYVRLTPFQDWCIARYLESPESNAQLIATWNGKKKCKTLSGKDSTTCEIELFPWLLELRSDDIPS